MKATLFAVGCIGLFGCAPTSRTPPRAAIQLFAFFDHASRRLRCPTFQLSLKGRDKLRRAAHARMYHATFFTHNLTLLNLGAERLGISRLSDSKSFLSLHSFS